MLFTELDKIDRDAVWNRLEALLQEKGVDPHVLQDRLGEDVRVEELLSDVVLSLLGDAAQANRESFRERQRRGFEQAQEKGTPIGRPCQRDDKQFARVRELYRTGGISGQEAADMLRISRGTFYRWLKEACAEDEKSAK